MGLDADAIEAVLRKRYKDPKKVEAEVLTPLKNMLPATQMMTWNGVQPKLTDYIPITPHPKQAEFLKLDCLDALYGGAAGGGKSVSLLAAALQFVNVPGYAALVLRKTYAELSLPKALMSVAREWLSPTTARWKDHEKTWYIPTDGAPATLTFGYLENPDDRFRYQSSAFQFIAFDEMTEFLENDATFLFSRLRKEVDMPVPLRFRGATNPTGAGRLWVKKRYVDSETRGDRIFIPAKLDDNPSLSRDDYLQALSFITDPIERAQILAGDWEAQASGKFKRNWFRITRIAPTGCRTVRYYDLAATEPAKGKDPSWTVGVLLGELAGRYYVLDMVRDRLSPRGVEDLVLQTAELDGKTTQIWMEQEPGSSGVRCVEDYRRLLAGYDFHADKVTGPKEIRANGLASQAEGGNVLMVSAEWNRIALDELEIFPGGGHDDCVTAMSGAFNALTSLPKLDTRGIVLVGERARPDW